MKKASKFIAVILVIATLGSLFLIPVSAATSGGSGSRTIYVTTKANYWYPGASSVTLQQTKQTATYGQFTSNKIKTKAEYYGFYDIRIYNVTKNTSKSITWDGGKTKKISLDPNCTYRITVSYNPTATVVFNVKSPNPAYNNYKGITSPSWKISSTWKLASCY